jgi:oligopeptide transport system substrate-binding protein
MIKVGDFIMQEEEVGSGSCETDPIENKYVIARRLLKRLIARFPRIADHHLLKELDRMTAFLETAFTEQRTAKHLAKLASLIFFVRKRLTRNLTLFPYEDHFDVRIFPSFLYFTFGLKPVLSLLTHAHLKNKYELFDEEQLISIISKALPNVQLVKDSVYVYQTSKSPIKTLYFEIHKITGLPFNSLEINRLKNALQQEMKFSIQQLIPRIFMIRNEEEILKNILTLNREIRYISDFPQVMIVFDQQTFTEAIFTIILLRVLKSGQKSLSDHFTTINTVEFLPERSQIVRYLKKKHPIEANVFRLKLKKDASLLRFDNSLNFYLARQQISHLLVSAIGKFRDYNGGIIIQQREVLAHLKESFQAVSIKEPDLVENFYYSLSPIEAQATLPLGTLRLLFSLFLEVKGLKPSRASDFFLKFHRQENRFLIVVRTLDQSVKEALDALVASFQKDANFSLEVQNSYFVGFLLAGLDHQTERHLSESIVSCLEQWKASIESRQVLKLGLEHPIVSLDPRIGGDETSAVILKMLFEGLMRINRAGKLENGVAHEVEISPDRTTYTFHLRPSLWSNGNLVSAGDFEYAWKKVLSPTFKTSFAYLFYPIKNAKRAKQGLLSLDKIGIEALDSLTLQVKLEFPAPYFLELTAHTIYSPIHRLIDERHPNWPLEDRGYICNGAFQLKYQRPNEKYELTKNQLFWDAANIRLDEIMLLKLSHHHCYESFQKGMNHWIGSPLGTWDPNFLSDDEKLSFLGAIVYWFVFHTKRFPFNNKKIRRAFSYGIDREKFAQQLKVPLAYSPIPPIHSQVDAAILCSNRLEEAQALFKEALDELGISLRDFPVIHLAYLTGPIRDQVAHFIKEEWERVFGIRCLIESFEWKTLFSKMTQGDFQIGGMTWEPWINDAIYTLNAFRDAHEPINFPKWEYPQYQQILQLAERESDMDKRKSYYLQAEQMLLDEMPVMPLFLVKAPALKKRNFHIHHCSPLINFKWGYFS